MSWEIEYQRWLSGYGGAGDIGPREAYEAGYKAAIKDLSMNVKSTVNYPEFVLSTATVWLFKDQSRKDTKREPL